MNAKKSKQIYDEICEVLRKHDAHIFIDGNGAYGTAEFCDGLLPPTTRDMYDDGCNKLERNSVMGALGPTKNPVKCKECGRLTGGSFTGVDTCGKCSKKYEPGHCTSGEPNVYPLAVNAPLVEEAARG